MLSCRFRVDEKRKNTISQMRLGSVLKMLIRILNTLPSRIWDIVFFLFSDYLNPQLVGVGILQKVMAFRKIKA